MRWLPTRRLSEVALLAALLATVSGTAFAYFTTTGTGNASTGVSKLTTPTIATATPAAGGTVALTWATVTPPSSGTVTYSVSRNGGSANGTCAPTLTATTCTDSGLAIGTYSYVVTAKWRSWTASSAVKTANVTVGPADHFTLTAASSTPTAGAADNLTITAKDAGGNTVTTYTGSHGLTFSGALTSPNETAPTVSDSSGVNVAFGSATAINFTAGVAAVSASTNGVMKLYKSGAASIKVSDGSISNETPLAVTVSAATASKFVLTAESTALAAGAADNLTITAQDTYGNTATAYTGSHNLTFSGASASPNATKPTVVSSAGTVTNFGTATALSFTSGVAAVASAKNGVMKLYASGTANVEATDGTVTTKTPLEVTVSPLAATKFALTAATTTPTAGASDNLTTTAQDTYGNVATAYAGSHSLTFSGALASPDETVPTVSNASGADIAFGSATTINFTAGIATVSASKNGEMTLYKSGATSLKVGDGTLATETALAVTVSAATASKFILTAATNTPAAGASDNLTTTAQDTYDNVATAYAGSHSLTFSGAVASPGGTKPTVVSSGNTATNFGTATALSFTAGVAAVTSSKNGLMKIYASGEADIEASDGTISTETPLEVTVSPLVASKFVLTAVTATPTSGEANNLTTTAQDTYGNVATAYTGSHSLTYSTASASPSGAVPTVSDSSGADIAFGSATATDFNAGVATVSGAKNGVVKLYKTGATSLKATDGTLLTPTALVVTVAPGAAVKFAFSASATSLAAGGSSNLTTTAQDIYGNTVTTYTGSHNLTYSGASASPNATAPTVVSSAGAVTNFGTATAITFTAGVASVASSKNGLMKLYRAESANITVSDGSISSATPIAVTVSPTTASKWALTNINVSAGTLGSTCLFTCTLTGLGNSGTVKAKVAVADTYGNTVSALGTGHAAKVTTNGVGTFSGTPLVIPSTGAAESATTFTFTAKSSGTYTEILTVAASEGTAYTAATLTATK
jgi:hypothetical protein